MKMPITLEIRYWHSKPQKLDWIGDENIKYESKSEYKKGLKKILARIDDSGYNAMVLNNCCGFLSRTRILFIDEGRFRQC